MYGTETETDGAIKAAGIKRSDVFVTTKSGSALSPLHPLTPAI